MRGSEASFPTPRSSAGALPPACHMLARACAGAAGAGGDPCPCVVAAIWGSWGELVPAARPGRVAPLPAEWRS